MNSYEQLLKLDIKKIPPGAEYPVVVGRGLLLLHLHVNMVPYTHIFIYLFETAG
jgi:hypothetical protein